MGESIQRPTFFEGQILAATDLQEGVDHGRGQVARHSRLLHSWGIVDGLELNTREATTADGSTFLEVFLAPGMALDGTGREIVVPETLRISESSFIQANVLSTQVDANYPLFLIGRDETITGRVTLTGACAQAGDRRVIEGNEILFGRPGEELDLDLQAVPSVEEGPGGNSADIWRVLLGFVQWDDDLRKFTAVATDYNGIGRRYAGVKADQVVSISGTLSLQSHNDRQAGAPIIVMDKDATEGARVLFGLQNGQGGFTELMRLSSEGDLEIVGRLRAQLGSGAIKHESGILFDGMRVPLPPGITEQMVLDGDAVVHVQLSFRTPPTLGNETLGAYPRLLEFEPESRRVHCVWRLLQLSQLPADQVIAFDQPGSCSYTVIAETSEGDE